VNAALALLAGVFSTLSPCVLPLLPIVIATASSVHRWGSVALAAGLALSFTLVGLLITTMERALGIDGESLRLAGAAILVIVGVVLLVPRWQARLAGMATPFANWAGERGSHLSAGSGLTGQFGVGLLLGIVWSPCTGPTLGAASLVASQGSSLLGSGLTMLAFGIGASVPLLLLGTVSREATKRWRARLSLTGHVGKMVLGVVLIIIGAATLAGLDRSLESALTARMPAWLTTLATRY
jgi:cytochrome c-type biogenesis protein